MPAPTIGCQIAPDYEHDDSSSDSESTITEEEEAEQADSQTQRESDLNIEKAETQRDDGGVPPTRPNTLQHGRRKSSRSQQPPLEPVGFWHWQMAGVRLHVLKLWLRTNVILSVAILGFLCLFWGALFRQDKLVPSLGVWVVDFDGQVPPYQDVNPFVGPFVTRAVQSLANSKGMHPGFTIRSPADFDNDPLKVRESIWNFHAWAAIIINPNATALIEAAVLQGNSSYDPLGAGQIIYNTARDQGTTSSYIVASMTMIQKIAVSNFGREWISHLLQNASASELNLDTVPQAISPGIEFTIYDLRPFGPPVATPAVSIGLIYLIILSFFSFTFFLPIHMKYLSPKGHPPLHFHHLIIWRYVATVASYFLLSCIYSLVSLAFLMPMSNPPASHVWPARNPSSYHRATFVVYWMVNWVGMTAFGLASENMAMLLGTPWTALWLIFWVISNVATGFYALPLASSFYRWGYAWPMHNVVEVTRQILFDLHPRIGLNFGILFAWCAIDTALFPLCCYYMRWKTMREKRLAAKREAEWNAKMEKENEQPSFLARVTTLTGRSERSRSMEASQPA
ncbi:uncharacterized protein BDR25DRAFT_272967 [Lindgomyces ingoldianus]|uniref:Uncharacterized protein n=1 Tax=Lindgomyces ingoldianus TaxID=673940 RepID=A0ACB6Q9G5_9PLEO|nr:uncharacterized protein BDR25DRAFT_272967 [Lindgomyces ingoldianus]KAF2463547.1 hypothetical protein BDR25DRAFT_272967 [Lindgomyces ingoldianus]